MDLKVTKSIHCRWENPQSKRYYRYLLAKDLFGQWVVTRIWGGIGQATGRILHLPVFSHEEGLILLENIAKIRLSHGYQQVTFRKFHSFK